jgi:hypothetical protein
MKNKKFFITLLIEVVVVGIIALFFLFDMKDIYKFFVGDTLFYPQAKECDLHVSSCEAKFPNAQSMFFDIEPKDIPLMKELIFRVKTSKELRPESFDLHIYATNMNMGYHTFKLKKVDEDTYEAKGILPDCLVGGMIWNAEVVHNLPTKSEGGLFTFKTK